MQTARYDLPQNYKFLALTKFTNATGLNIIMFVVPKTSLTLDSDVQVTTLRYNVHYALHDTNINIDEMNVLLAKLSRL